MSWNPIQVDFMLLASHTMPDFVTPVFWSLLAWCAIPILAGGLIGALPASRSRARRISATVSGLVAGLLTATPFTILVIRMGMRHGDTGATIGYILGATAAFCVSFIASRLLSRDGQHLSNS